MTSSQPTRYYAIGEADEVFPEEWAPFIVPRQPELRAAFLDPHTDLLGPTFWKRTQQDILSGELHIGLPYRPRYPDLQRAPIVAEPT